MSFSRSHMKRKVNLECRAFEVQWGINYFGVEKNDKVMFIMQWHHSYTKREQHTTSLPNKARNRIFKAKKKLENLKQNAFTQRNLFSKIKNENEAVTKLSLLLAHLLVIKGKPFTDGDLMKSCLLVAAKEICPEKIDVFRSVSLSAKTTVRRVEDIGRDIKRQLENKAMNFKWFS